MTEILKTAYFKVRSLTARFDATDYWEERYAKGGNSGSGSYDRLAEFKAEVLNRFVNENQISSVIEFGCGDGNQLALAQYPNYIGLDVSKTAVQICEKKFSGDWTKSFFLYRSEAFFDRHGIFKSDLSLSLDVIYHITDDVTYDRYMQHLFLSGKRFVIVYSTNIILKPSAHEQNRRFTTWVEKNRPDWNLIEEIPNRYPYDPKKPEGTSKANFYIFKPRV